MVLRRSSILTGLAIYEQIENHHGLKRTEIPERLETFQKGLDDVLGVSAKTVERLITKNLYQKLGLNFKEAISSRKGLVRVRSLLESS